MANGLEQRIEDLELALVRIAQLARAYPPQNFPAPDWDRVGRLLAANGLALDALIASARREALSDVAAIAQEALGYERGNSE
jgi:hypothetical protein